VTHDGWQDALQVFRQYTRMAVQERPCLRCAQQGYGSTGRQSGEELAAVTRGPHDGLHVVQQCVAGMQFRDPLLQR
jgi:hypothetical protein